MGTINLKCVEAITWAVQMLLINPALHWVNSNCVIKDNVTTVVSILLTPNSSLPYSSLSPVSPLCFSNCRMPSNRAALLQEISFYFYSEVTFPFSLVWIWEGKAAVKISSLCKSSLWTLYPNKINMSYFLNNTCIYMLIFYDILLSGNKSYEGPKKLLHLLKWVNQFKLSYGLSNL